MSLGIALCGSVCCLNARAAIHEMEYSSSCVLQLVYCGGVAVGIETPQYKPFYTVP